MIFQEQDCARCHSGENYGGELLTPVDDFDIPESYFAHFEIHAESVGTDTSLATKTRKGTGFYKAPTLRGLWYRGLFGHDGSCASLEDCFDAKRLENNYAPTDWKGPGVSHHAVPGHNHGLNLSDEDKTALISFLKSL